MKEYVYKVVWAGFEEAFETYDEAYEFASANLTKKPVIEEVEIERNDFGECSDEGEPEIVWRAEDEEAVDTEVEPEDPEFSMDSDEEAYYQKMLHDWEDEECVDPYDADEFDGHESLDVEDDLDDDTLDLEEDTHPTEAQPEADRIAAYRKALQTAKAKNKPVIYGYMGADHHGGHRYYEIDQIVCDDLGHCTAEVMKKYKPSGSVLVAYPSGSDLVEALDDITAVKQILSKYYIPESDPKNKLGKEYVRALRDDEKLPRGFKFLAGSDTSGIVQYNGTKYYWTLTNGKITVELNEGFSQIDYNKLREELEANEDEVECQECFELFPKTECVHKEGVGYICKNCAK